MSPFPTRWLGILLISASGVAGYAAGSAGISPKKNGGGGKPEIPHDPRTSLRERRAEEDVFGNFEKLLSGTTKETDIWRCVSRLPVASIPGALKQLREAQAVAASGSSEAERLNAIESALFFHWAESDPQAALADVSTLPGKPDQAAQAKRTLLVKSVLAAWMRVDANAAYQAVKDHDDFGYTGRDMLVATWTAENVFKNADLFPDKHRDLLGWYCVAAAKDDGKRDAMLEALRTQPEMKDRDWAYFMLFRDWAYRDFGAAMGEAEKHERPGLTDHVLEDGLNRQPAAAMRWAVAHDIPPGGPRWEEGYKTWLMYDSDDAQSWLDEQTAAWTGSGHTDAVAGLLAQQLDSKFSIKGTVDPQAAGRKLVALVDEWKAKDPAAAGKWIETASPSARKLLAGEGDGSHE